VVAIDVVRDSAAPAALARSWAASWAACSATRSAADAVTTRQPSPVPIGGAVAGNEIEKRRSGAEHYRVTVELRDGRTAVFGQESLNGLRVGDRVRVADNRLYRE
jgi:hypothetical protein